MLRIDHLLMAMESIEILKSIAVGFHTFGKHFEPEDDLMKVKNYLRFSLELTRGDSGELSMAYRVLCAVKEV